MTIWKLKSNSFLKKVVYFIFFICSCSNRDRKYSPQQTDIYKQYKFGLHTMTNKKFYYDINNEIYASFKANGQDIESINNSTARLLYEVVKADSNGCLIKMTYDKFHINQKNGNQKYELDADNANSSNPIERELSLLKSGSIYITLKNDGVVTKISGYKELADTIVNFAHAPDGPEKEKMRAELSNMLGETFITTNTEQAFGILPRGAIKLGETWQKKQSEPNIGLSILSNYKLVSISDNVAKIESEADIDNSAGGKINLDGF